MERRRKKTTCSISLIPYIQKPKKVNGVIVGYEWKKRVAGDVVKKNN